MRRVERELADVIRALADRYELTEAETLRMVHVAFSDWIGGLARSMIREERHGDATMTGGLAGKREEER